MLVTCGEFTPQGEFVELPELDIERLEAAWQEAVFALYLAEDKIEPEVVENMRSWQHSGFSVDQSVYLPAGDQPGIERLVRYMTRCPFSLSRLVKVTETGQVIYKAEGSNATGKKDLDRSVLFAHHFLCPPRSTTSTSSMSATGEKGKEDYGQETALGGTSSDQAAVCCFRAQRVQTRNTSRRVHQSLTAPNHRLISSPGPRRARLISTRLLTTSNQWSGPMMGCRS